MLTTDKEAKRFWQIVIPVVKKLIAAYLDEHGYKRCLPAEVVEVDNAAHYASVRLLTAAVSATQVMRLMNCSGKELKVGDKVWIEYAYSLDNAYIAILNNGKPWGWS